MAINHHQTQKQQVAHLVQWELNGQREGRFGSYNSKLYCTVFDAGDGNVIWINFKGFPENKGRETLVLNKHTSLIYTIILTNVTSKIWQQKQKLIQQKINNDA